MITLIRSECCFLFVLSPDAPQFHFRMSAAPRRQDDDDERMRVLCARRLILQWNKYNKEEEKKKLTSFRCTFGSSRYNKPQRILRPCECYFIFFRPVLPRAEQATAGPQGDRKGMALI